MPLPLGIFLNLATQAKERGVRFVRKRELTDERVKEIRDLRQSGETVPSIIRRTSFSKASIYRALGNGGYQPSVYRINAS